MVNIIICYICVAYTMLGGIKAVVYTDVSYSLCQNEESLFSIKLKTLSSMEILGFTSIRNGCICCASCCSGHPSDRGCHGSLESCRWRWPHFSTKVSLDSNLHHLITFQVPPMQIKHSLAIVDKKFILLCSMSLSLTPRVTFWNSIFGVLIMWTSHVSFHQNCAQRLISLPSVQKAKRFFKNSIFSSNSIKMLLFDFNSSKIIHFSERWWCFLLAFSSSWVLILWPVLFFTHIITDAIQWKWESSPNMTNWCHDSFKMSLVTYQACRAFS